LKRVSEQSARENFILEVEESGRWIKLHNEKFVTFILRQIRVNSLRRADRGYSTLGKEEKREDTNGTAYIDYLCIGLERTV
jgi:hypothetical protein